MLTLYYRTPLTGIRRQGTFRVPWRIDKVTFRPLADGALPPEPEIIKACHNLMRDVDGNAVPGSVLKGYDLKEGLAAAFRSVEAAHERAGDPIGEVAQ